MKNQEKGLIQVVESEEAQLFLDRRNPEKRITSLSDIDLAKFLISMQERIINFFGIPQEKVMVNFSQDGAEIIKEVQKDYHYLTALDFSQITSIGFLKTLETKTYGTFSIQTFFKVLDEYRVYSQRLTTKGQRQLLARSTHVNERDTEIGKWEEMGESISEYLEEMRKEFPKEAERIERKKWLNRVRANKIK